MVPIKSASVKRNSAANVGDKSEKINIYLFYAITFGAEGRKLLLQKLEVTFDVGSTL